MLPTALLEDLASAWTDLAVPTRIGIMGLGVFLGVQLWNMIPPKDSQHDEPPYLPYTIPCESRVSSNGHYLPLSAARRPIQTSLSTLFNST